MTQGVGWPRVPEIALVGGRSAGLAVLLVVVTPVVAFYLIYDWHRMIRTAVVAPVHQRETVASAREIDAAIRLLRGQTAVCLILGSFYAAALTLSGLNFGLLIGLISGVITFIPYVGSMTGLILALGVAVAQFWPAYSSILTVLGIFLVGQFLEGNLLAPKLVGESVGLHPVWLIFALLAFGYLFGFVGLLVAVPLAATIGVLVRFALQRYRESSLYTGEKAGWAWEVRSVRVNWCSHSIMPKASRARIFARTSNAAALCWWIAGRLAGSHRCADWTGRLRRAISPRSGRRVRALAFWRRNF